MSMKNSNDTIGNRTRDLPTCSAMPQPTAPTRTPLVVVVVLPNEFNNNLHSFITTTTTTNFIQSF